VGVLAAIERVRAGGWVIVNTLNTWQAVNASVTVTLHTPALSVVTFGVV
jgi:hypothetical protein